MIDTFMTFVAAYVELFAAYLGADWGYVANAQLSGESVAQDVVNAVAEAGAQARANQ